MKLKVQFNLLQLNGFVVNKTFEDVEHYYLNTDVLVIKRKNQNEVVVSLYTVQWYKVIKED